MPIRALPRRHIRLVYIHFGSSGECCDTLIPWMEPQILRLCRIRAAIILIKHRQRFNLCQIGFNLTNAVLFFQQCIKMTDFRANHVPKYLESLPSYALPPHHIHSLLPLYPWSYSHLRLIKRQVSSSISD